MTRNWKIVIPALAASAGAAHAQVTFEPIAQGYVGLDISADGEAVAGNSSSDGIFETFRWTRATGIVRLGRSSGAAFGKGAGTPGISYDGTAVSATIADATTTYITPGLWVEGVGWTDSFGPLLPESTLIDGSYGSAWGISGDGQTVVGLYWRDSSVTGGGGAHGYVHHDVNGPSSPNPAGDTSTRLMCASEDASVVAGWWREPLLGWKPTVWRNGTKQVLADSLLSCMVHESNPTGDVLVGSDAIGNINFPTPVAARWVWNGAAYDNQSLGNLPGTFNYPTGSCWAEGTSGDGKIVVGVNRFLENGPHYSDETGFIWTPRTGMIDVEDYLADNGIVINADADVRGLMNISVDGGTIMGLLMDTGTLEFGTYLLHIPVACSGADITTQGAPEGHSNYGMPDGVISGADINYYVNAWIGGDLITGDMTTTGAGIGDPGYGVPDGNVTGADIQYYVNLWIAGCP